MGILAEMALRRARGRLNSVQSRAAAKAPVKAEVGPTSSEVVVTGPINRFMFLEGRSWAIDMVASLRASTVAVVVERLAGAAVDRPGSYAAGIESVIKELKECSQ
ncbi:hypothetical protein [Pseudomonas guariconensis]|uniref:hypothetical protein n=1 Tax=Pseudomonas guariconensis TaxID=1288410 RepID=UPI002F3ECDE9